MDVQLVLELLGQQLETETHVLRSLVLDRDMLVLLGLVLALLDMKVQLLLLLMESSVDAQLVLEILGQQLDLEIHVLRSPALVRHILVLLGLVLALLDMKVLLK